VSPDDIRTAVLHALATVAPEARGVALSPSVPLRDQLDLDSMDFLNVVIAIHRALHVDIPEADYASLATLDGAVRYLGSRVGEQSRLP
jgi:acyl carrier protein